MYPIKTLILEDQDKPYKHLKRVITEFFPKKLQLIDNESILGKGNYLVKNEVDGRKLIEEGKPKWVFMDIVLGNVNGIELIQILERVDFWIIYTTGTKDQYARKVLDANLRRTIAFLDKPIRTKKIEKVIQNFDPCEGTEYCQFQALGETVFLKYSQIIKIKYEELHKQKKTIVYFLESTPEAELRVEKIILRSNTIKEIYRELPKHTFFSPNQSTIINKIFLESYNHYDRNLCIKMRGCEYDNSMGEKVPERRKNEFYEWLKKAN